MSSLSLSKKNKKNSPPRSFCAFFAQLSQASQNTERWAPVPAAPIRAALAGRCSRRQKKKKKRKQRLREPIKLSDSPLHRQWSEKKKSDDLPPPPSSPPSPAAVSHHFLKKVLGRRWRGQIWVGGGCGWDYFLSFFPSLRFWICWFYCAQPGAAGAHLARTLETFKSICLLHNQTVFLPHANAPKSSAIVVGIALFLPCFGPTGCATCLCSCCRITFPIYYWDQCCLQLPSELLLNRMIIMKLHMSIHFCITAIRSQIGCFISPLAAASATGLLHPPHPV